MTCPENITQNTDPGKYSAIVHWIPAVANDSSGFLNATSDYKPGDIFNISITVVTYSVVERGYVRESCSFTVNIEGELSCNKTTIIIIM